MQNVPGPETDLQVTFTQLVETYHKPLLNLCYMTLRDRTQAEDAVQETFLKAYKALGQFRGESSEKTWLFRIGMNVCRDMRRGRWFRYVDRRVTPDTLPIPAAEADEDHEELAQAIVLLPDEYKEVILLHYYQGWGIAEIAEMMELPEGTISSRLSRGRKKLESILKGGDAR